jgi:hypothetical protein
MKSNRWPGLVPASIVIVAMILLWMAWIGARVALPDSEPARAAVSHSTPDSSCPEESRV